MNNIFCGMEKLSLVDFDGHLACTIFTGGCNYKCPYCHNSPLIGIPNPPIEFSEIMDYLEKRQGILDAVVISGGEPTVHKDLPEIIKQIKDLGYLVKLDTNGTNPKMLKELIDNKLIDYVAMDIKNGLANYNIVTGVKNSFVDNIKESINILINGNLDYEFRTTLVKEYHEKSDIEEIAELLKGSKKLILQKFVLRETCLDQSLHEVPLVLAKEFVKILQKKVNVVALRGY